MYLYGSKKVWGIKECLGYHQLVRKMKVRVMSESDTLKIILAYVAENRLKSALEDEDRHMAIEAN